jgi:hypothetical protein
VPPQDQLLKEARILRRAIPDDPGIARLCSAVEELLADGWTERRGPFEPRQAPLHEAWGGREPPETFAEVNAPAPGRERPAIKKGPKAAM